MMFTIGKRVFYFCVLFLVIVVTLTLMVFVYQKSLNSPPNVLWALFSGYYRYDPRQQDPPKGLFLDRPETSLTYFFDSTLKACDGTYPPLSNIKVDRYEVEAVEYLGHTDYHAFSLVHTRVYLANGRSARVVFRFEAGHNEGYFLISEKYPLLLTNASTVNAGAWISLSGLLRDPDSTPPGWSHYVLDGHPFICNPGPPESIEDLQ